MKKLAVLGLSLSLLALSACGNSTASQDDELNIVTTFYPVYEFTKQVVGEEGTVDLLIEAGTEVHDFEPSAKDIAVIQEADTFVYENENMETWVPDVLDTIDTEQVGVIKATEGMLLLPGSEEEEHDHAEGEEHHHAYDPHVWLSPERSITLVETIRDGLIAQYPEKKLFLKKMRQHILKN